MVVRTLNLGPPQKTTVTGLQVPGWPVWKTADTPMHQHHPSVCVSIDKAVVMFKKNRPPLDRFGFPPEMCGG